jgi:iron only hydrogenase large subunit-like protein
MSSPVYTTENGCQDCYKCVRHCPVKAIRIIGGKASVIPEACVACGECVKVCPAHAKKIRSDLARLKELLASGAEVYASVAPSFTGYFRGVTIGQLASALMRAGFAGVSETAHGAESVSAHVARLLEATDSPLVISSACPAAVDMIRKYLPGFAGTISPLPSPVRAHCRLIKEKISSSAKVVFFGPCAAKKNEADAHPDELALAVVFPALERLLGEKGIVIGEEAPLALGAAAEGRFYSVEGGMNDTLRDGGAKVRYLSVSGLDNLRRLLDGVDPASLAARADGRKIFLEVLACPGGCVNGPAMPQGGGSLDTLFATDETAPLQTSVGRNFAHCGVSAYPASPVVEDEPEERFVADALARVGKITKSDELNCGACGYTTCREFAKALISGKAEEAMCHTYLKRNFERTSNALIRYIPAGVVIVDGKGAIRECNRIFAELSGALEEFEALGNLEGLKIDTFLPEFADLFAGALDHGSEIVKYRQHWRGRIVTVSVFPIARGEFAGAVVQDVTQNEGRREEIAAKAREVIRKNVYTVQQVARLFGEHIAETEVMLNEIAGSYESHTEGRRLRESGSGDYLNG